MTPQPQFDPTKTIYDWNQPMPEAKEETTDPNWPLQSFDALDWAKEFIKRFPSVPLDMAQVWFANAIMRGYDEHARRYTEPQTSEPIVTPDYLDHDATEFAHPAWFRGCDHMIAVLCQKINEILDGRDGGRGVGHEPWESTKRRLIALVNKPEPIEQTAQAVDAGEMPTMEHTTPILIGDLLRRDDLYPDPNGYLLAIPETSIGERVFIEGFRRRIPAPVQEPAAQTPSVDLWQHEREQYRKTIDGLNDLNNVCMNEMGKLTAERDKLAGVLAQQSENFRNISAVSSELLVERDQLKAELVKEIGEANRACFERDAWRDKCDELRNELDTIKQRLAEYRDFVGADSGVARMQQVQCVIDYALGTVDSLKAKPEDEPKWRTPTDKDAKRRSECEVSNDGLRWEVGRTLIAVIPTSSTPFKTITKDKSADGHVFARIRDDEKGVSE